MNKHTLADTFLGYRPLPGDIVISPEMEKIINDVKNSVGGAAPLQSVEKLPY